jgi:ATP-dependent DNA ligase
VSVTREIWSPTLQRTVLKLRAQRAAWRLPKAFEDGQALWDAICEHELEGVVAKRLDEPYLCGERSWVKRMSQLPARLSALEGDRGRGPCLGPGKAD